MPYMGMGLWGSPTEGTCPGGGAPLALDGMEGRRNPWPEFALGVFEASDFAGVGLMLAGGFEAFAGPRKPGAGLHCPPWALITRCLRALSLPPKSVMRAMMRHR